MSLLHNTLRGQVIQAVQDAGALLTNHEALRDIRSKSATDYVTNIDLSVQTALRDRLNVLAPQVQFMGEEQDNSAIDPARPFWILDPVDGTTNLIHDFQHSAVSLALAEDGQVTFGVVYQPYTGECFTAQRGQGAFRNGSPIHVSPAARPEQCLMAVGTVPGHRELAEQTFVQMRALYEACQDIRRTGCASLDLCWVACGRTDGYLELFLQPWDYAAGLVIVQEAGGAVTAPDGSPLSLLRGGPLLASNGLLHPVLQTILS